MRYWFSVSPRSALDWRIPWYAKTVTSTLIPPASMHSTILVLRLSMTQLVFVTNACWLPDCNREGHRPTWSTNPWVYFQCIILFLSTTSKSEISKSDTTSQPSDFNCVCVLNFNWSNRGDVSCRRLSGSGDQRSTASWIPRTCVTPLRMPCRIPRFQQQISVNNCRYWVGGLCSVERVRYYYILQYSNYSRNNES